MNEQKLTEKQLRAAKQYIGIRYTGSRIPDDYQQISIRFIDMVKMIAEYGALRAGSVSKGGSVDEPGEIYFTKVERASMNTGQEG